MLKYTDYNIVFQEIPDEVTLAINLSGCPNCCPGCHSPHLQLSIGTELTEKILIDLLDRYSHSVTCICLMGGDGDPQMVAQLSEYIHLHRPNIRTGWYSGRAELPSGFRSSALDYLKLGPYIATLGGLRSPTTNQRLYQLHADGSRTDLTDRFRQFIVQ